MTISTNSKTWIPLDTDGNAYQKQRGILWYNVFRHTPSVPPGRQVFYWATIFPSSSGQFRFLTQTGKESATPVNLPNKRTAEAAADRHWENNRRAAAELRATLNKARELYPAYEQAPSAARRRALGKLKQRIIEAAGQLPERQIKAILGLDKWTLDQGEALIKKLPDA